MSLVYFMQAGQDGPIKIGVALDIRKRFAGLVSGCPDPLIVLGHISGDRKLEQRLHRVLRDSRRHQEWFNLTDDTQCLVQDALSLPADTFLSRVRQFEQREHDRIEWLRANPVNTDRILATYRLCLQELRREAHSESICQKLGIGQRTLFSQTVGANEPRAALMFRFIAAYPTAFAPLLYAIYDVVATPHLWPSYAELFPVSGDGEG